MKISIAIICMVMISALSASAQKMQTSPPTKATQTMPPKTEESIVFEKTTHDYGTIAQGANGDSEFKFTNTGKAPLILSNVKASCGCTVPEWPKEPIAPGKAGSIKVKYNTATVGAFNKSITVNSNAVNSMVVLQIRGTVTAPKNQSTQTQNTTATAPKSSVSASSKTNNPTAPTIENARRMNSPQTPSMASPTTGTKPRLNPPHGQPWHRCDIAVGSPLS